MTRLAYRLLMLLLLPLVLMTGNKTALDDWFRDVFR